MIKFELILTETRQTTNEHFPLGAALPDWLGSEWEIPWFPLYIHKIPTPRLSRILPTFLLCRYYSETWRTGISHLYIDPETDAVFLEIPMKKLTRSLAAEIPFPVTHNTRKKFFETKNILLLIYIYWPKWDLRSIITKRVLQIPMFCSRGFCDYKINEFFFFKCWFRLYFIQILL